MIFHLSTANIRLRVSKQTNCLLLRDLIKKRKIKNYTTGKRIMFKMINFILNISSDYFRLRNPNKLKSLEN